MPISGDVVDVRLGSPEGHEAGHDRPAVVVSAQGVLDQGIGVVFVAPLTSTLRGYASEVDVEPDEGNGLDQPSTVQCQHLRAVATSRLGAARGNVGPEVLALVRDVLADLLDLR